MAARSPLDDPDCAAHAWARFRKLMRTAAAITALVIVAAIVALSRLDGEAPLFFYIATAIGIALAMMLAAALMGLIFLSSGTGHDEAAADSRDEES